MSGDQLFSERDSKLYERGKHWRLVKQSRKIGGPYFLQLGRYRSTSGLTSYRMIWNTETEYDFRTREAAIAWLQTAPDSWGPKNFVLGTKEAI